MADPNLVFPAHEKYTVTLGFTNDGRILATGGFDGGIKTWNVEDGEMLASADAHPQSVNCGAVTTQEKLLTGSTDTTLAVWTLPDLQKQATLTGHKKTVAGIAPHPNQPQVASTSYDTTVRIWNTDSPEEPLVLEGHPRNVTTVDFTHDGTHVISGGLEDEALVWKPPETEPVTQLTGHGSAVAGIAATEDGDVWTVAYKGVVRRWEPDGWLEHTSFQLPENTVPSGIDAHPDTGQLAITRDNGVLLYSAGGELQEQHTTPIKGISHPRWSPEGNNLAVGGSDGKTRIYR